MHLAGRLGSLCALNYRPRVNVVLSGGEEGDIAEKLIARADESVKAALGEAELFHEHGGVLSVHIADILFEFRGNRQNCRALRFSYSFKRIEVCVIRVIGHTVLVQICDEDDGLYAEKAAVRKDILILIGELEGAGGLFLVEMLKKRLAHLDLALIFLVAALGVLLGSFEAALGDINIGKDELEIECLGIAGSVRALKEDIIVFEAAHDLHESIRLADGVQSFVALTAALANADHVDELDRGRGVLLGVVILGKPVKSCIGHLCHADIGLCAGNGVCPRLSLGTGHCVEKRCLADIGQTYYTKLHYMISLKEDY